MNKQYKTISECRSCGSTNIEPILDLGKQPLANSLKQSATESEDVYSLSTAFCRDCCLFQLLETVNKERLFTKYVWVTGTSKGARDYSEVFCQRAIERAGLKENDFVCEIASNDGTFLKPFKANGFNVLGVDPAENIAQMAINDGIETLKTFWGSSAAQKIVTDYAKPKLIFARNVIPHVSELHDVIESLSKALDDEGTGIIEFHYSGIIIDELHYDSIYHEHLCYFTICSMENLLKRYGFKSFHVDFSPISGGSYVIYFAKNEKEQTKEFIELKKKEEESGCNTLESWQKFAADSRQHREESLDLLSKFSGKRVVGFGSSARSSTYLNFCGINQTHLEAIIDNNPLKQGLFAAGSSVPIVSFDEGLKLKPDVIFILAWNFKDEIMAECNTKGFNGEYIVPFPHSPVLIEEGAQV